MLIGILLYFTLVHSSQALLMYICILLTTILLHDCAVFTIHNVCIASGWHREVPALGRYFEISEVKSGDPIAARPMQYGINRHYSPNLHIVMYITNRYLITLTSCNYDNKYIRYIAYQ